MSKHQNRRGQRAGRSSTSQGKSEPWCARIKGTDLGVSEGSLISDHGLPPSNESQQGAADGRYSINWRVFHIV